MATKFRRDGALPLDVFECRQKEDPTTSQATSIGRLCDALTGDGETTSNFLEGENAWHEMQHVIMKDITWNCRPENAGHKNAIFAKVWVDPAAAGDCCMRCALSDREWSCICSMCYVAGSFLLHLQTRVVDMITHCTVCCADIRMVLYGAIW